jgi:hypothetical protein
MFADLCGCKPGFDPTSGDTAHDGVAWNVAHHDTARGYDRSTADLAGRNQYGPMTYPDVILYDDPVSQTLTRIRDRLPHNVYVVVITVDKRDMRGDQDLASDIGLGQKQAAISDPDKVAEPNFPCGNPKQGRQLAMEVAAMVYPRMTQPPEKVPRKVDQLPHMYSARWYSWTLLRVTEVRTLPIAGRNSAAWLCHLGNTSHSRLSVETLPYRG